MKTIIKRKLKWLLVAPKLISEKDLRTKTRDKEKYFTMLKGSIHQEHITALLYIKKKLIELKISYMFYCISSL